MRTSVLGSRNQTVYTPNVATKRREYFINKITAQKHGLKFLLIRHFYLEIALMHDKQRYCF